MSSSSPPLSDMLKKQFLIIDDDPTTSNLLCEKLASCGFEIIITTSYTDGLKWIDVNPPMLVLLDLHMHSEDRWDFCRRMRSLTDVPILITSDLLPEDAIVHMLESGADAYLPKPFSQKLLCASIEALLRRYNPAITLQDASTYQDDHLFVDLESRTIRVKNCPIKLTPTEYNLFAYLLQNAGRVVTHAQITEDVWGWNTEKDVRSIQVYISQLRKKLEENPHEPKYLLTEHGVGYRFKPQ